MITITVTIKHSDDNNFEVNWKARSKNDECHPGEAQIAELYRHGHESIFNFLTHRAGIGTAFTCDQKTPAEVRKALRDATKAAHYRKLREKIKGLGVQLWCLECKQKEQHCTCKRKRRRNDTR